MNFINYWLLFVFLWGQICIINNLIGILFILLCLLLLVFTIYLVCSAIYRLSQLKLAVSNDKEHRCLWSKCISIFKLALVDWFDATEEVAARLTEQPNIECVDIDKYDIAHCLQKRADSLFEGNLFFFVAFPWVLAFGIQNDNILPLAFRELHHHAQCCSLLRIALLLTILITLLIFELEASIRFELSAEQVIKQRRLSGALLSENWNNFHVYIFRFWLFSHFYYFFLSVYFNNNFLERIRDVGLFNDFLCNFLNLYINICIMW